MNDEYQSIILFTKNPQTLVLFYILMELITIIYSDLSKILIISHSISPISCNNELNIMLTTTIKAIKMSKFNIVYPMRTITSCLFVDGILHFNPIPTKRIKIPKTIKDSNEKI